MGRGLSQLQKDILGTAFNVNAYTQNGTPAVKTGNPVDGYRVPTLDYQGAKDCKTGLMIYATGGVCPSLHMQSGEKNTGVFEGTPQFKKTKASVTRAVTRLMDRGLLVYAPQPSWYLGYLLTREGFDIGQDNQRDINSIDAALELFGITRWQGKHVADRDRGRNWYCYTIHYF